MGKYRYYAVRKGKLCGIYTTWEDCQQQINGFTNAEFKGFDTRPGAESFLFPGQLQGQLERQERQQRQQQQVLPAAVSPEMARRDAGRRVLEDITLRRFTDQVIRKLGRVA